MPAHGSLNDDGTGRRPTPSASPARSTAKVREPRVAVIEDDGPDRALRLSAPTTSAVVPRGAGDPGADTPESGRGRSGTATYLFKFVILAQVFVYMEAGAVPALLHTLKRTFDLSFFIQGALGAVVYLFLSLGCPLAGTLFSKYRVKYVMAAALLLNDACVLAFGLCPDGWPHLLVLLRAFIGFTQAFVTVYSPVWVDEFAPLEKQTSWMSFLQASVPIGVMVGYVLGSVATWVGTCPLGECWRYPFFAQAVVMLPLSVGVLWIPDEHIDTSIDDDESEDADSAAAAFAATAFGIDDDDASAKLRINGISGGARDVEAGDDTHREHTSPVPMPPRETPPPGAASARHGVSTSVGAGAAGSLDAAASYGEATGSSYIARPAGHTSVRHARGGSVGANVGASPGPGHAVGGGGDGGGLYNTVGRSGAHRATAGSGAAAFSGGGKRRDRGSTVGTELALYNEPILRRNQRRRGRGRRSSVQFSMRLEHPYMPDAGHDLKRNLTAFAPQMPGFASASVSANLRERAATGTVTSPTGASSRRADDTSLLAGDAAGERPVLEDTIMPLGASRPTTRPRRSSSVASEAMEMRPRINSAFAYDDIVSTRGLCSDIIALLSLPIYMLVVVALSGLYFVVTGVQFWATDFLITVLHAPQAKVQLLFVVTSATGPVLGVFFGGWLVDKLGGYRGEGQAKIALLTDSTLGLLATACAVPATYFTNVYAVCGCLWGLLFFGGAVLPSATGIYIAAVPLRMRALASSFSVIIFNLLGYFMSPFVSGWLMGALHSYTWGFRVVLFWSGVPLVFLGIAAVVAVCSGDRSVSGRFVGVGGNGGEEEDQVTPLLPGRSKVYAKEGGGGMKDGVHGSALLGFADGERGYDEHGPGSYGSLDEGSRLAGSGLAAVHGAGGGGGGGIRHGDL